MSSMKHILLITYYFPPCGGAAVQRWLRFLPLLVQAGYKITVLTPQEGDFPYYDYSLVSKLPPAVRVIHTPSMNLRKLFRKLSGSKAILPHGDLKEFAQGSLGQRLVLWGRLNLVIPDIRISWNRFARQSAQKLLLTDKFDVIITSGPPHSTHLVGYYLKKRYKLRWIADFRDPWTKIHYLQQNPPLVPTRKIHQALEARILRTADLSLVVSQAISDELPRGNKCVLYNGFNQLDFHAQQYQRGPLFRIKYVGQLTAGQDISPLLDLILKTFNGSGISISFVGTRLDPQILALYQDRIESGVIEIIGFTSHEEAIGEMVNAELLVLLINDTAFNKGIVTTKLFEYMGSRTPVLCLGPLQSEAALLLDQFQAGMCFAYSDQAGQAEYIQKLYSDWQRQSDLKSDKDLSAITVQNQIQNLISVLEADS